MPAPAARRGGAGAGRPRQAARSAAPREPGRAPVGAAAPRSRAAMVRADARTLSRASLLPARTAPIQGLLVEAIALHDAPVHRLHAAVHRLVRLEDPAHLAPRLGRA